MKLKALIKVAINLPVHMITESLESLEHPTHFYVHKKNHKIEHDNEKKLSKLNKKIKNDSIH